MGRTQKTSKPFKFDLKVKGQRCIGIMNVTSSEYDDTATCQIWYDNVKATKKKHLRVGHESAQTDRLIIPI